MTQQFFIYKYLSQKNFDPLMSQVETVLFQEQQNTHEESDEYKEIVPKFDYSYGSQKQTPLSISEYHKSQKYGQIVNPTASLTAKNPKRSLFNQPQFGYQIHNASGSSDVVQTPRMTTKKLKIPQYYHSQATPRVYRPGMPNKLPQHCLNHNNQNALSPHFVPNNSPDMRKWKFTQNNLFIIPSLSSPKTIGNSKNKILNGKK